MRIDEACLQKPHVVCNVHGDLPQCLQVTVFEYSLHMLNATLTSKSGCCLVYRKSSKGHSLLSYAVETCSLLLMTNETLDHLLSWCEIRIAKTSTKAMKARKLMETQHVQSRCSSTSIEKILAILKDQEEKRKNKRKNEEDKNNEDEDFRHETCRTACWNLQ